MLDKISRIENCNHILCSKATFGQFDSISELLTDFDSTMVNYSEINWISSWDNLYYRLSQLEILLSSYSLNFKGYTQRPGNLMSAHLYHSPAHSILFPTELHLKNAYYLYSACSNPTGVV